MKNGKLEEIEISDIWGYKNHNFLNKGSIAEYMVHDDRLFYCGRYKHFKEEADGELKEEKDDEVDGFGKWWRLE